LPQVQAQETAVWVSHFVAYIIKEQSDLHKQPFLLAGNGKSDNDAKKNRCPK
jgi:hypothetical protein